MPASVVHNFFVVLSRHMLTDDPLSTKVMGMNLFSQVIVRYKT